MASYKGRFNINDEFRDAFELALGQKLRMQLKFILQIQEYNSVQALKNLGPKDWGIIECFMQEQCLHILKKDVPIELYYGHFASRPTEFKFMGGWRHIFKAMIEFGDTESPFFTNSSVDPQFRDEINHLNSLIRKWLLKNVTNLGHCPPLSIKIQKSSDNDKKLECHIKCPDGDCLCVLKGSKVQGASWKHNFYKHMLTHITKK